MLKPYTPHPERDARMQSAVILAKGVLSVATEVLPRQLNQALSLSIWFYTEADGKYACRYRSLGAMNESDGRQLRHEHVLTRKYLVEALVAQPDRVEEVLASSLACLVTKDGHDRLSRARPWQRRR